MPRQGCIPAFLFGHIVGTVVHIKIHQGFCRARHTFVRFLRQHLNHPVKPFPAQRHAPLRLHIIADKSVIVSKELYRLHIVGFRRSLHPRQKAGGILATECIIIHAKHILRRSIALLGSMGYCLDGLPCRDGIPFSGMAFYKLPDDFEILR